MALFPAFSEVSENKIENSTEEFDWLKNKSFPTGDALNIQARFLKNSEGLNEREASVGRDVSSTEEKARGDRNVPPKTRKSEKKRKKKKKHKKRNGGDSSSSGTDSDTIYPSDLKKKEEDNGQHPAPLTSQFSWLDDLQSSTKQMFCVDCKPDPANWTYKSLYRGDVARYRRKGTSSLGLDCRKQEISWEDSKKKRKQKGDGGADRYFSTASRHLLRSEPSVSVKPATPDSSEGNTSTSFLPLDNPERDNREQETSERVQTSSVNPLGIYDSSTALWLQGKGRQDEQKQITQVEESAAHVAGKTEEFNRHLREHPSDTQQWLQFIQYQDELGASVFGGNEGLQGSESSECKSKSSYKAVLEKKLSIAERAVAINPTCISLQLERLRICQELWEPSVLAKEWKKLVFLHPNSAPLWRRYLLFIQSYFSNFTVSKVNSAYGKCLSTLSAVLDGSMVSHSALPGTEEDMLDLFIQQCQFLRQAGHSEKAISLFQAMMDFTFFKPDSVKKLSTRQQVEFFEPFWDSGEARVGEVEARGWKAWMLQQERGGWLPPPTEEEDKEEEDEEEVKNRSQAKWKVWLDVESLREAAHWLPWRPDKAKGQTEEDCDDPDRQVLFDDIGSSLICLSSPELRLRLLLYFLSFLGLPVASILSEVSQPSLFLENLSVLTQGKEPQRPLTSYDIPDLGVDSVGHMTTLQGKRKWVGLGRQGERFLTNMLSMLQPVLPPHHRASLTLSLLQYEKLKVLRSLHSGNKKRLHSQGKSSKRVVKRLLKEPDNRSSLILWREYAHLEWLLGNLVEARKVFSTASAMGGVKDLSGAALCELCLLWSQLELEEAAKEQSRLTDVTTSPAVCVLTKLAEGTSASFPFSQSLSPVSILKARKSYEQALAASLSDLEQSIKNSQPDTKDQEKLPEEKLRLRGLVGCYALFQYLTVGVHAAVSVYSLARENMEQLYHTLAPEKPLSSNEKANLTRAEAGNCEAGSRPQNHSYVSQLAHECEVLAVQQAALLKYHSSNSVFPLATLRQTLTSAISSWPSCALLWGIYVQVENRYHSAGRARRFFHSVTRDSGGVVPRLFAIVAEQQRKQLVDSAQRSCHYNEALPILPENGLGNRIRGLFETATKTEDGAHCPLLWRMYIHFLVSDGKVDKARAIFYKALQNVPWVKGLYMDAVQLFPEHLQEFIDLMMEKELRLRLPLEELDILLED
ncbi:protein NRDE2 homolog isoform X1 [Oryzias latipes]|uniref:protein NRDE2 homolog isoform X1 n=1 Tax=Oryzias latipes TaxID=8090 RepID=UPI0002A484DC|nr:protein NRDE2 homolog isoform X1 [Oryzias latipes]